jgi:hypothetical protein
MFSILLFGFLDALYTLINKSYIGSFSLTFRHIKSDQNILLLNVCGSLVLGYVVFLLAVENTGNEVQQLLWICDLIWHLIVVNDNADQPCCNVQAIELLTVFCFVYHINRRWFTIQRRGGLCCCKSSTLQFIALYQKTLRYIFCRSCVQFLQRLYTISFWLHSSVCWGWVPTISSASQWRTMPCT